MAISDFTVLFTRRYRKDGQNLADEPYYLGQLPGTTGNVSGLSFPESYFQNYYENFPEKYLGPWAISSGGFTRSDGMFSAYKPGSMYRPLKAYTWSDFVSNDTLQKVVNEYLRIYNNVGSEINYYYVPNEDLLFFNYDNGYKMRLFVKMHFAKTNIAPNTYVARNAEIEFHLEYTYSSHPELMPAGEYGTEFPQGLPYTPAFTRLATNGVSAGSIGWNVDRALSRFIDNFKRARFYLFVKSGIEEGVNVDGVLYSRDNWFPLGQAYPFRILTDLTNCSSFPVAGFTMGPVFYPYPSIPDEDFVVDRKNGGPEPNDPDERPDPYDPDPPKWEDDEGGDGDFDDEDDIIDPPGVPTISGSGAALFKIFNPTQGQLYDLAHKLWTKDVIDIIKAYFTNPLDALLGLSIIPVQPKTTTSADIYLGFYNTNVKAPLVDSDYVVVNCGIIPVTRYYGSYLDYNPYTKVSMFLPYIGDVELNPDEIMNTNVGVIYYVNVVTGDTSALITSDGSVIYEASGNCIRQLPLSQTDYSSIINTAVSAVSSIAGAVAGSGVTSAMQNQALEAGKSTEIITARANVNNVGTGASLVQDVMGGKFGYKHAGSMGTGSGQLGVQVPFLTIERPNLDLADNYKGQVGYPCNKTMTLSRCSGFTQVEAVKLSVSGATDVELAEITGLLMQGVII